MVAPARLLDPATVTVRRPRSAGPAQAGPAARPWRPPRPRPPPAAGRCARRHRRLRRAPPRAAPDAPAETAPDRRRLRRAGAGGDRPPNRRPPHPRHGRRARGTPSRRSIASSIRGSGAGAGAARHALGRRRHPRRRAGRRGAALRADRPPSLANLRRVLAGWLSLNAGFYGFAALLVAACLAGSSRLLVRQLGRRSS